jgi:hypothetical protein
MRLINLLFLVSVALLSVAAVLTYGNLSSTNDLILHFSALGQPDYIGSRSEVMNVIMTAGVLVLLNYLLARVLRQRERFFALVLMIASPVVALLLLLAVSVIVVNNQ